MRPQLSGRFVSVVVAAAAVLGATATAPALAGGGPWAVVRTPNPVNTRGTSNVDFYATSASGPADAWGVGVSQGKHAYYLPMTEHWDGSTWNAVTVPAPAHRQAYLQGVADLSAADAWTVGLSNPLSSTNEDAQTLIEHWNGTGWAIVPSPDPVKPGPSSGDTLNAVAADGPDDVWAVGWVDSPRAINTLVEHWNGTAWTGQVLAAPGGGAVIATAVTVVSPDDVWAVGQSASGSTDAALHFDGTRWTFVGVPSPFQGAASREFVTGVSAASARDIWASGYADTNRGAKDLKPYMLHWTGTAWKTVIVPNPNPYGSILLGTLALSAGDVWAVGHTQIRSGSFSSLTEQFNGTTWSVVPSPSPGDVSGSHFDTLFGLASTGGHTIWALGERASSRPCCSRTLALRNTSG
jgi:hypothetical protein